MSIFMADIISHKASDNEFYPIIKIPEHSIPFI